LVFDTFRFVTSIAGQSRAKSFGHAERRQAFSLAATHMTQHSGHVIILKPKLDIKNYEQLDFVQKNIQHLTRLREILSFINPENYRGTGREHFELEPFWIDDNGELQDLQGSNPGAYKNGEAKKQLSIYEDKNKPTDTLDDLCFFSLDEMKNVFGLIENKDDYEMLEILENEKVTNDKTIGFDIGYIGGDFFSAIADTAIKPMWHPPDFDDMDDITEHLVRYVQCLERCLDDGSSDHGAVRRGHGSKKEKKGSGRL
jgi:hypothetical protein